MDLSTHPSEFASSQYAIDRSLTSDRPRYRCWKVSNEWVREAGVPKEQPLWSLVHIEVEVASDNQWKSPIITKCIVKYLAELATTEVVSIPAFEVHVVGD